MNKNKKIFVVLALALVLCMGIASISAYFTDTDTATNTFTIGEIKLDLQEPSWDDTDTDGDGTPDAAEDIQPNQTIAKDPRVENTGINDEFVFLTVEVPYSTIVSADLDGTLANNGEAKQTQLFTYTVNAGWVQVGDPEWSEADADGNGTVTYVYAYATNGTMTSLKSGDVTGTLFDNVTFVNAIEEQGLENSTKNVIVNAYGIQTTNLNGGQTSVNAVWGVVVSQTGLDIGVDVDSEAPVVASTYTKVMLSNADGKVYGYDTDGASTEIGDPAVGSEWQINITGTVSDNVDTIDNVSVIWYNEAGEAVAEAEVVVADGATWTATFKPVDADYHVNNSNIVISAKDESGNVGSYTIAVEVEQA